MDIFEKRIICCKTKITQISFKDEARQKLACIEKRIKMYEDLEKGDEEGKRLLQEIKELKKKEQKILKNN